MLDSCKSNLALEWNTAGVDVEDCSLPNFKTGCKLRRTVLLDSYIICIMFL